MSEADNPFGRQPEPVTVIIQGDPRDVEYWRQHLMRAAEFKGDLVQDASADCRSFAIYPRAVND